MNRVYRLIWNDLTRTWVAVAESAMGRGKRAGGTVGRARNPHQTRRAVVACVKLLVVSVALIGAPVQALDSNALPTGGSVVAGSAAISQTANVLTVQQASQRVALNWQSFNIGAAATVNFIQPNASAVALNRIIGNEASQIYGKLNANGQVFFTNPNGMLFARGAEVNVGGLMATTLNISNSDFMAGNYRFSGAGSGTIRNEGLINALGGIALVGNSVQNAGQLIATTVTLAAGDTVVVDLSGDGLIRARVVDPALKARIENSGSIYGAQLALTTGQARDTLDRVVNNSGVIRATGLALVGGEIVLEGGSVQVAGKLDASSAAGAGGTVKVLGSDLSVTGAIDVMGATGGGTILVGGDYQGKNPAMQNASHTYVGPDATLRADATQSGDAGKVIVWADNSTVFQGRISARGGAVEGSGGLVEVSGKQDLAFAGFVDAGAVNGRAGTLLLDPKNIIIGTPSAELATGQTFFQFDTSTVTVTPAAITGVLSNGTTLFLQANNDITQNAGADITVPTVGSTAGAGLSLQAGRSIALNANITTLNGSVTLVANETMANGVVSANREAGAATIAMAGANISAGTANVTVTLSDGVGNASRDSASIALGTVSGANINVSNLGTVGGPATIVLNGPVSASANVSFIAKGAMSQLVGARISALGLTAEAAGGIVLGEANLVSSFSASNVTSGNVTLSNTAATLSLGAISQAGGGALSITNNGNMSLGGAITAGAAATLTTSGGGNVAFVAGSLTAGSLTIDASGGITSGTATTDISSTTNAGTGITLIARSGAIGAAANPLVLSKATGSPISLTTVAAGTNGAIYLAGAGEIDASTDLTVTTNTTTAETVSVTSIGAKDVTISASLDMGLDNLILTSGRDILFNTAGVTVKAGSLKLNSSVATGVAKFTNAAGLIDIAAPLSANIDMQFSGAGGTQLASVSYAAAYSGTVSAGSLKVLGTTDIGNGFYVFAPGTANFVGAVTAPTSFLKANGNTTIGAASSVNQLIVYGGTQTITGPLTTNIATLSGSTLTGAGALTTNGLTTLSGDVTISGKTWANSAAGTVKMTDSAGHLYLGAGSAVSNAGTWSQGSSSIVLQGGVFNNTGAGVLTTSATAATATTATTATTTNAATATTTSVTAAIQTAVATTVSTVVATATQSAALTTQTALSSSATKIESTSSVGSTNSIEVGSTLSGDAAAGVATKSDAVVSMATIANTGMTDATATSGLVEVTATSSTAMIATSATQLSGDKPVTISTATTSGNVVITASSSQSSADKPKTEEKPAVKPLVFVVANNTVQKTVDQLVQVDKPKGSQLMCRPG